jgi:hypothetical protein
MNRRIAVGASLAVALLVGSVLAADSLKSGPPVGQKIPGPFHPLNINGSAAGTKACQV